MGKGRDIIISCVKQKNTSQHKLADAMGVSVQTINQQLAGCDMKLEKFTEMLDYLGYRVSVEDLGAIHRVSPEMLAELANDNVDVTGNRQVWAYDSGLYKALFSQGVKHEIRLFETKDECIDYLKVCGN